MPRDKKPKRASKGSSRPPYKGTPLADDMYEEDEPSTVSDRDSTDNLLLKIGMMVEKQGVHVKQIPAMAKTLTEVVTVQAVMDKRQETMDDRLGVMEKNGHPCKQEVLITKHEAESREWREDREEGIKTRGVVNKVVADIEAVDEDLKGAKKSSRGLLVSMVVAAVGIIVTVVGAAWSTGGDISGLSERIEGEKAVRAEQHKALETRLNRLPTAEQTPTKQQIKAIETAVQNGDEFAERCQKLTRDQKRHLGRQVQSGHLPPSLLCL